MTQRGPLGEQRLGPFDGESVAAENWRRAGKEWPPARDTQSTHANDAEKPQAPNFAPASVMGVGAGALLETIVVA